MLSIRWVIYYWQCGPQDKLSAWVVLGQKRLGGPALIGPSFRGLLIDASAAINDQSRIIQFTPWATACTSRTFKNCPISQFDCLYHLQVGRMGLIDWGKTTGKHLWRPGTWVRVGWNYSETPVARTMGQDSDPFNQLRPRDLRNSVGDLPVQRLNARVKLAESENPSR
jgi:hypothetical protein